MEKNSGSESAHRPGGSRCVHPAQLLPASAAPTAARGSPSHYQDGDVLLPGEGSEAKGAAAARPVPEAEGGGQVLFNL